MYMVAAKPIWRAWERHTPCPAFSRAWVRTGKRVAARIATIAITTSSSVSVKPRFFGERFVQTNMVDLPFMIWLREVLQRHNVIVVETHEDSAGHDGVARRVHGEAVVK